MPYAIAPVIGIILTVMNAVNSRFSSLVGNLPSVIVVHLVGLLAISALIVFQPRQKKAKRLPLYLYSGGVIGVGTIVACNIAYGNLDASLAVSLSLLGQTAFSIFVDGTGFLGRKKYPLKGGALIGVGIALIGIAVMSGSNFHHGIFAPVALLAGILPAFSFIVNSRLSETVGILRGTRANYSTGLVTALAVTLVWNLVAPSGDQASWAEFLPALSVAGPFLILSGGLMGVVMIGAANFIFPRLPALYATLLIFAGQAFAGLALDSVTGGSVDIRKLIGVFIVLSGLGLNTLLSSKTPLLAGQTCAKD